MSEELSKRIDDLHERFDDLRGDINRRFDEVNSRCAELPSVRRDAIHLAVMGQRFRSKLSGHGKIGDE